MRNNFSRQISVELQNHLFSKDCLQRSSAHAGNQNKRGHLKSVAIMIAKGSIILLVLALVSLLSSAISQLSFEFTRDR